MCDGCYELSSGGEDLTSSNCCVVQFNSNNQLHSLLFSEPVYFRCERLFSPLCLVLSAHSCATVLLSLKLNLSKRVPNAIAASSHFTTLTRFEALRLLDIGPMLAVTVSGACKSEYSSSKWRATESNTYRAKNCQWPNSIVTRDPTACPQQAHNHAGRPQRPQLIIDTYTTVSDRLGDAPQYRQRYLHTKNTCTFRQIVMD